MTQIAMEVYETNDFKRYGEKIHFYDNIKKPELLERIETMNYEGGIYSPYNALFYAAISALRSGEIFHEDAGAREHTGVSYLLSGPLFDHMFLESYFVHNVYDKSYQWIRRVF